MEFFSKVTAFLVSISFYSVCFAGQMNDPLQISDLRPGVSALANPSNDVIDDVSVNVILVAKSMDLIEKIKENPSNIENVFHMIDMSLLDLLSKVQTALLPSEKVELVQIFVEVLEALMAKEWNISQSKQNQQALHDYSKILLLIEGIRGKLRLENIGMHRVVEIKKAINLSGLSLYESITNKLRPQLDQKIHSMFMNWCSENAASSCFLLKEIDFRLKNPSPTDAKNIGPNSGASNNSALQGMPAAFPGQIAPASNMPPPQQFDSSHPPMSLGGHDSRLMSPPGESAFGIQAHNALNPSNINQGINRPGQAVAPPQQNTWLRVPPHQQLGYGQMPNPTPGYQPLEAQAAY